MVTLTNLRLPATWSTALPQDNNFDISRNELDDFLEAIGDIDWGATNFLNVGQINGNDITDFWTTLANGLLGDLQDTDPAISTGNFEGDIAFYDGANWNKIPRGTDGQFLKSSATGILWGTGISQINDFSDADFTWFNDADANKKAQVDATGITSGQTRVYALPDANGTLALLADIPVVSGTFLDNAFKIQDDGDPTKEFVFQAAGISTATVRTITVPDKDGVMAMISDITSPGNTFPDDLFRVQDNGDASRQVGFEVGGNTTGKTMLIASNVSDDKTYSVPDAGTLLTPLIADVFVMEDFAQTLSNKTIDNTNIIDNGGLSADVVLETIINTYTPGLKQTFAHDATNAGFNIAPIAGSPSVQADGDIWYDFTAQQLFGRINGADVDLGSVTPQDSSFVITATGEIDDLVVDLASPTTTFRMTFPFTLNTGTGLTLGVRASVRDFPVGSDIIVDIKQGGVSILTGQIHIDDGDLESVSSLTQATILTSALTDNALIEVFVTQIGSTTPGKGLKVYLIGSS